MSTNISKQKRERLLQKLEELKKHILLQDDKAAADTYLPLLNEAQNAINARRYELVYEEHREAVDDRLLSHLPVLTEEKELAIRREGTMNFSQIAAQLNYSTIHHFSRQFKDKFGMSPSEYAKSIQSE